MRVLIGTDTFAPDVNGASGFARDLAVRLSRRGHTVHVIAPSTSLVGDTRVEVFDGERIVVHRLRSLRWPLHEWVRFAPPWEVRSAVGKILDTIHPDIVHVQSFINIGRGLAVETRTRGIPLIATNHVMPENMVAFSGLPRPLHPVVVRFGWNVASSVLRRADVVTSPTPLAAAYLEQNTVLESVVPLSCGVDLARFVPHLGRPPENRILYVGRLDPEKNVTTLLCAVALLPVALRATLDVVGDGSQRRNLERLTATLGIADRVRFHGRIDDHALTGMHAKAAVFVMPSTAELQSIATLEAMASGTPVVLADAMALPHLVDRGRNGYLVPARNPHAFADAIQSILSLDDDAYLAMRQHSRQKAIQHDSTEVTRQYENLYRLAGRPPSERSVSRR